VEYRAAVAGDADEIAELHAESWRLHYRGAYSDEFLDSAVFPERSKVWRERFAASPGGTSTIVAVNGSVIVGFVHTVFGSDPQWGALLDNLHVRSDMKRHGIGRRLVVEAARSVMVDGRSPGMYLWVLEQNVAAQGFYRAQGGIDVERVLAGPFPGGGRAWSHRYAWRDASVLCLAEPATRDGSRE
jgi:ribosomal protein S18 acetylase RimI-like enzyme